MKKIILVSIVSAFAALAVNAQDIPDRKRDFQPMEKHHRHGRHGMPDMKALNLTDDQKAKFKTQNEEFRKQMTELKKNDNITVKEWKSKMETLRKDHKSRMDAILTPEQKDKLQKMKSDGMQKHEGAMKQRGADLKTRLGLTDDQANKMATARKEMAEKMKLIREDKNMEADKKKEKIKELMDEQKEQMKKILTDEQLKKMKESRRDHAPKKQAEI
jgi:Spy/CpxP family protein refolding chaperone